MFLNARIRTIIIYETNIFISKYSVIGTDKYMRSKKRASLDII